MVDYRVLLGTRKITMNVQFAYYLIHTTLSVGLINDLLCIKKLMLRNTEELAHVHTLCKSISFLLYTIPWRHTSSKNQPNCYENKKERYYSDILLRGRRSLDRKRSVEKGRVQLIIHCQRWKIRGRHELRNGEERFQVVFCSQALPTCGIQSLPGKSKFGYCNSILHGVPLRLGYCTCPQRQYPSTNSQPTWR